MSVDVEAFPVELADLGNVAVRDVHTGAILERRRRGFQRDRGELLRRTLLLADLGGLVAAFLLARALAGGSELLGTGEALALFLPTLPLWVVLAKVYGLYDADEGPAHHSTIDDLGRLFHIILVGTWLYAFVRYGLGLGGPELVRDSAFCVLGVTFVGFGRAGARAFARRRIEYLQNTVIVGGGEVGQLVARKLLLHPEYGINVVGFVDAAPKERRDDLEHLALLGPPERLPELVRTLDVERVIIAFSNEHHEEVLDLIRTLRDLNVQVDIVPRLFDLIGPGVHLHTVEGLPLIGLSKLRLSRSSLFLKRALDVSLASLALVALAPLLAAIALAIKLDSRGPVIFRQVRMGRGGRPFHVYKLRTMVVGADDRKQEVAHLNLHLLPGGDSRMFKIAHDPRVTRVGRYLRRYFVDELPQLFNVLKGEMSLIGPRPLILAEAEHVADWGCRRLDLKPGMTGVWQVLGRSAISFEEMVKLDYLYVTTWSLGNDLRLLFQTVPLVVRGDTAV